MMIIRRKEINIQFLALQVLETCPREKGTDFITGYTAFVECFFQDLDFCSDAFTDGNGNFEVDLYVVIDLSLETLQSFFNQLPLEQRKNYWLGVTSAVKNSESILKFAFEVFTTNEAA
jgi:hypothetical protein